MLAKKQSLQYYLFSLANFLAAFGGGMILGKGISVINSPFLHGGSMMAFFIGTVFGLALLQLIPKTLSALSAKWLSISGGFASLVLLNIFKNYSVDEKLYGIAALLFFFILSIRFGFWFYSRVLRASISAGQQQQIAWVELGYYTGMIFGLIIWKFLNINISIISALLVDSALQFSAGFLDLYANKIYLTKPEKYQSDNQATIPNNKLQLHKRIWGWRLASAVIFLTIGIQVVIFNLAHQTSEYFSPYILAIFYFGASIAAVFYNKFKIQLSWRHRTNYASLFTEKMKKEINLILIVMISVFFVSASVFGANYWVQKNHGETLLLICIFCSAFLYEIMALAILDRIGLEEQLSNQNGMVIWTYGMMGISAAISLWILGVTQSYFYGLILTLIICVIFSTAAIWKRNLTLQP